MALVLILNSHGVPTHWANWQTAVTYKAKGLVNWEMGDHEFTKLGGSSRLTGERSQITYSTIMSVRGDHHPKRMTPILNNSNLFGRDRNICAYCGRIHREEKLTNDHIVPRSKGGAHSWMNCVTACKACNNHKGSRSLEDLDWELLYAPYVPSREEALILRNRNVLADQMDFLRKMLPAHSRLLSS